MTARAITGFALANGLGPSTDGILDAVLEGRSRWAPPPEAFELPFTTVSLASTAEQPLPAPYHDRDTRHHRIAWPALQELAPTVAAARARWGAHRIGVVVGTSTGGLEATETAYRRREDNRMPPGFDFERMHPVHVVADFTAHVLGVRGPAYAVSTACSSSAKALASALRLLDLGVCDAVVVGGVDSLCNTTLRGFHALGILAEGPCRPFDVARNGINISEGAAYLVVEREGRGRAELVAVGEAGEAFHLSAPEPSGQGARAAMEAALHRAGLRPEDVGYVNAHGTATPQNDAAEALAIAALFGDRVAVSSTKGVTGHMLGAAGATEAVICAAALERGVLPPTSGCTTVDPTAASLDLLRAPRRARVRYALSNSFAFGGSNASVLLRAVS